MAARLDYWQSYPLAPPPRMLVAGAAAAAERPRRILQSALEHNGIVALHGVRRLAPVHRG